MLIPSGKSVYSSTPIYPNSHFTWGEVTKNCTRHLEDLWIDGKLIIDTETIYKNIVATAIKLDAVRDILGDRPILINSWYRPSSVNRDVGGSKYSRHQYGDAIDLRSNYLSPKQIYNLLEPTHNSGGIHCYYNFVHIDWRGNRARW